MFLAEPPSQKTSRPLLAAIVLLHLVLGFWYCASTPYRTPGHILSSRGAPAQDIGAPDERPHANYVASLEEGKGVPPFVPGSPDLYENLEGHQPPLYYGLTAVYAKATGLSADTIRSTEGARVRWLNLLFGAAGLLGLYALGNWGFGRRDIGLIAAGFAAVLPMNIALNSAVSNDPLLITLCVWATALTARGVRDGWSVKLCVAIGLVTAAAAMTKTSALALFPILLVAAIVRRPKVPEIAALLVPALLIPLPWWIRNQSLYGDPFALKAFKEAFVGSPQASMFIEGFGMFGYFTNWVGWWTARSFIGAFGYMDIWLNENSNPTAQTPNALYRIMLALLLVLFVGWVLRLKDADKPERKLHLMLALLFGLVVVQFIGFNLTYFQAQSRYLFPALGAIASGVAWGALRLSKGNWKVALAVVMVPLLAVALLAGSILPAEFAKRL